MEVFGTSNLASVSARCRIARYVPGEDSRMEDGEVQLEHTLLVHVNGEPTMRIVCTPTDLFDLVVGRLFTQGIISDIDDVESIRIDEDAENAFAVLRGIAADFSKQGIDTVQTTGMGNRILNRYFEKDATEPVKVRPIPWKPEWVFSLARRFAEDTPMHKSTFGTHSCYLAREDEVLFCCEDLGRHNAFDKAIGFALRNGIDLTQSIIFSSGRLPVDMVVKGIRSGVPILVSKAVPTAMTIELAKEYDLTLICSARPDGMNVFNDPLANRA